MNAPYRRSTDETRHFPPLVPVSRAARTAAEITGAIALAAVVFAVLSIWFGPSA